jgi:hypothetical protein
MTFEDRKLSFEAGKMRFEDRKLRFEAGNFDFDFDWDRNRKLIVMTPTLVPD